MIINIVFIPMVMLCLFANRRIKLFAILFGLLFVFFAQDALASDVSEELVDKNSLISLDSDLEFKTNLLLSEILPTPESGPDGEFIEITNASQTAVSMSGWYIQDNSGKSFHLPNEMVDPGSYKVFYHLETKISLNDDSDIVTLFDPDGVTKSSVDYAHPKRGESYIFLDQGWQWSKLPSPGKANQANPSIKPESPEELIPETITKAREQEDGQEAEVTGTITAPPGSISLNYFYIQDEEAGIQIYSHDKDFPNLNSGDLVKVHGTLSNTNGERRLKIKALTDITIIIANSPPIQPTKIEIPEISETVEGMTIKTEGRVIETSGDQFKIADNSGQSIKVVIRQSDRVNKPKLKKDDLVEVAGIVSQYKDEYRILPFDDKSVKILTSETLPVAGGNELLILAIGFILDFILWNTYQKVKKRHTSWQLHWLKIFRVVKF